MALQLTIDVDGFERARGGLRRLRQAGEDLTPIMRSIAGQMESHTVGHFDTETAPDGRPWKPSLRARAEGGRTLTDAGRLRRSITSSATADTASVGTNLVYAAIHQTGGQIRAKTKKGLVFRIGGAWVRKREVTIPARPFIGLSTALQEDIEGIVVRRLDAAAGGGPSSGAGA
ncbi:phage virion morphogenesis protein [Minwuia thermotolerans]|uniref:Phage virion morphogenesis protein n=1 Tax=Minwuia thermotolerans TaxID=2056226 RepID=A0A2M9G438_9PROT|nr:phage virion morphogenesis protein [Minwuia thermotolerans]PJK29333.1 phage virion morphogenesis protein [Minwuia thermotolerans]PJK30482.1 phage virion morphogenesis protein [Minwuia thermotolerans]PJK30705.1 phage virion morphogenesis protein [Minwuia thermotolerans]